MKKSLKVFLSIIIGIVLMSSCGGGKSDVAKVKPEKIQITGDLSEYLQIIDGEYEVTDNFGAHLSIKVKALKALKEDEMKDKNFELSASLLNENGMPISGTGDLICYVNNYDKLINLLKSGSGEEIVELTSMLGEYNAKEHADKVKKFSVSSSMKEIEEGYSSSSDETEASSSENNEDWDAVLTSYESYIDQYIKLMKKAKNGDTSAMTEYASMMEKATDLSEKMQNAGDELSTSQMKKFMKLQTKLASAAADM